MTNNTILIIDNYDSFTYNLYQYVGDVMRSAEMPFSIDVYRNDEISLKQIYQNNYARIIISPGPGSPDDRAYFGICAEVLTEVGREVPVLGVCLGMQGMAHYFGGHVCRAVLPMHGKTSKIVHDNTGVFAGIPQGVAVMRYHSLIADPKALPDSLVVTARVLPSDDDKKIVTTIKNIPDQYKSYEGVNPAMLSRIVTEHPTEIMGLRHKEYPVEGIQFHPESFGTEGGKTMLRNFLL
ncbi:MAG: anthranilate synthase component II [Patescibacteria group bacterium]